jgi:hypothetical protein
MMEQETTTIDIKKITQENIRDAKEKTKSLSEFFLKKMEKIENEFFKYFNELAKHSTLFQLKSTDNQKNFDVTVVPIDKNGEKDYSKGCVTVDTITVKYKTHQIFVDREKLPKNFPHVSIDICEHITSGRRYTNHGYKIKFSLGWDKEKYYKQGKKITETINKKLTDLEILSEYERKQKQFEERIVQFLNEKFGEGTWKKEYGKKTVLEGYNVILENNITILISFGRDYDWNIKPNVCSVSFPPTFDLDRIKEILKSL